MSIEIYRGINPKEEEKRWWIVGPRIENGLLNTSQVKVKFENIEKGKIKESEARELNVTSMALLVKGKIIFDFENSKEPCLLDQPGDHVIWTPNCYHSAYALEDTTLISVRWKNKR